MLSAGQAVAGPRVVPGAGDLLYPCVGDVVDPCRALVTRKGLVFDPCSTSTGAEMAPSKAGSSGRGPWYALNWLKKLNRFVTSRTADSK